MINFWQNFEIKTLNLKDRNYPEKLKKISDPPQTLFYRGNPPNKEPCFAIVGTRRCSDYGKEIAFSIAQDLARAGLTIVSGMARGIDTFAHKGALEAKGRTIAVLGTGLDSKSIYPRENLKLAEEILKQGGCLISEYPAGQGGGRFTFPKRNRIISAISAGVLVVEAKAKSGALITAEWARKQGRKIFAVPGDIHSRNSRGPHFLLKRGAILTESADDILKELNISPSREKVRGRPALIKPEEALIIKALSQGALPVDKIIEKTGLPAPMVSSNLSVMEIEGRIKNLGANVYALLD